MQGFKLKFIDDEPPQVAIEHVDGVLGGLEGLTVAELRELATVALEGAKWLETTAALRYCATCVRSFLIDRALINRAHPLEGLDTLVGLVWAFIDWYEEARVAHTVPPVQTHDHIRKCLIAGRNWVKNHPRTPIEELSIEYICDAVRQGQVFWS